MPFTARSQPARDAIVTAARDLFTEEGYDRTTIRAVAARAGVDPSMVIRYYGSKDGLFTAAVSIDLQLPDPVATGPEDLGATLAAHFVDIWEGHASSEKIMVLLRSSVTNAAATERIRAVFSEQVQELVRVATDSAPDHALRAGLISTQLLGTALTRYILRFPPMAELSPETLVSILAPVLQHYLTGELEQRSTRLPAQAP